MPRNLPDVMRRAISQLILTQEFWASIVLSMKLVEVEEKVPKMLVPLLGDFRAATDGDKIYYSRKFIESLTPAVCTFVLAHEAAHAMLLHLDRVYEGVISVKGFDFARDPLGRKLTKQPEVWNTAGDFAINLMLQESGFSLWKDCLINPNYKGMSTEQIYKQLMDQMPKCPTCGGSGETGGKGDDKQDGGGSGQTEDPNSDQASGGSSGGDQDKDSKPCPTCSGQGKTGPAAGKSLVGGDLVVPEEGTNHHDRAEEWKDRIVRAAATAKSRGTVPGCIADYIKEITEPQYPVWYLLEQFADTAIKAARDSSWKNPDRSLWPYGIVMPGDHDEVVPHVFLWYDTSGSVSDHELARFHRIGGDIIRNLHPEKLSVGQCDARVSSVVHVESDSDWPEQIKCSGRGGTSFKPPFKWMEEEHTEPTVMIYLTDLMGDFPEYAPPFPTLWVSTMAGHEAPFGETIYLPPDEGNEQ